ncbi:MAG TPA: hypothetical protein VGN11_06235 [Candidatus Baltobacteraceae bacterium]|nr:hypothetical protein [Candidatus Baltobacteraceae bacterium]
MKVRFAAALLAAICAFGAIARADEGPTYNGPLSAGETSFVQAMQRDLNARFPHASDAEKAGYVRYTSEDDSGAISYANQQWVSDPTHPSQLWYDKNGNLIGADFSVPRPNGEPRPQLWGINPGRWVEFEGHVHWVLRNPATGAYTYDQWAWNHDFIAAGGSLSKPTAATVVKLGKTSSASDVVTIFEFPTIWDLVVWVKPNPNGAFMWKNPLVTP